MKKSIFQTAPSK